MGSVKFECYTDSLIVLDTSTYMYFEAVSVQSFNKSKYKRPRNSVVILDTQTYDTLT